MAQSDTAAEQLEKGADQPVAGQDASADFWEIRPGVDEAVVGDYPQTEPCDAELSQECDESEGLGPDGFLEVDVPDQRLRPRARWTDVVNAGLPASWSQGLLLNDKALAAFKRCRLGTYREYPASVADGSEGRRLTYLHVRNIVEPAAIDFERSEFYVADMLGLPGGGGRDRLLRGVARSDTESAERRTRRVRGL